MMKATQKDRKIADKGENLKSYKFIIVGNTGVGKSCLLIRYANNEYSGEYESTIGVEFQSKIVTIEGTQVKVMIWDTAGQETFKSIVKSFYKKSVGVFLVYSITNQDSFNSIKQWLTEARENAEESAIFVLVGTQKDREGERRVKREVAEAFQRENKIDLFFEVSSKDNIEVEKCFEMATKTAFLKEMNSKLKNSISGNSFISNNDSTQPISSHNKSVGLQPQSKQPLKKKKDCC